MGPIQIPNNRVGKLRGTRCPENIVVRSGNRHDFNLARKRPPSKRRVNAEQFLALRPKKRESARVTLGNEINARLIMDLRKSLSILWIPSQGANHFLTGNLNPGQKRLPVVKVPGT